MSEIFLAHDHSFIPHVFIFGMSVQEASTKFNQGLKEQIGFKICLSACNDVDLSVSITQKSLNQR